MINYQYFFYCYLHRVTVVNVMSVIIFDFFVPGGGGSLKFELNTLNVKTKAMMAISLTDFFVVEFLLQRTDQIKRHIALSALL